MGPAGPDGAGLEHREKTRLLNGAGSGFCDRPASRVRALRNPAQIRPVAIPTRKRSYSNNCTRHFRHSLCKPSFCLLLSNYVFSFLQCSSKLQIYITPLYLDS